MIKFYYHPTPNPAKIALFLEESGLEYEIVPVDTRKGEQHASSFLAINPNAKTPALVDGEAVLFDSSAILLYLAEKTGQFLSVPGPAGRGELLSWLMFMASGVGPYCGQAVHFRFFAPEPKDYAVNRYMFEAERHWGLINTRLADRTFMLGEVYSIVDMSIWGWGRVVPFLFGESAWTMFPNVKRLLDVINARPAAERAAALATSHSFKSEMDDEARAHMFPQNSRLTPA